MDLIQSMFDILPGWTTQFEISGKKYGGDIQTLTDDPRLRWHIEVVGGLLNKRVLELGPLEGAHTKTMLESGASEVLAIEGNKNCWLRCLVINEIFSLDRAIFILADFNNWVAECLSFFDVVSAAGVLYHQTNPAKLIFDLAKITDTVIVWSQVASDKNPAGKQTEVMGYKGKINDYGTGRSPSYCAGLDQYAVWLYPDEMIRCFKDAGFLNIIQKDCEPTIYGNCLLFVAKK